MTFFCFLKSNLNINLKNYILYDKIYKKIGDWGLGIGDWGLGFGGVGP
jgi:hypothetical protein